MELKFPIDHKSGVPIYVQIMNHVKHLIATGVLTPGQQLPTIRQLAVDITVNLNTVAHAYAELEREGLLIIQRGRGTFIAAPENGPDLTQMRDSKLQTLVDNLLPEYDNMPTWKYAAVHNIQRITSQNQECNNCHGQTDLFLTADDVDPDELEANQDVIVTEIPPTQ